VRANPRPLPELYAVSAVNRNRTELERVGDQGADIDVLDCAGGIARLGRIRAGEIGVQ